MKANKLTECRYTFKDFRRISRIKTAIAVGCFCLFGDFFGVYGWFAYL